MLFGKPLWHLSLSGIHLQIFSVFLSLSLTTSHSFRF
nr:MAG TPA: hypothetical protein [Caudoviricetes sp.]